jgi:hypothetical protein
LLGSGRAAGRSIWVFLARSCFPLKTFIQGFGFPWISLDSLVRIETYQWVATIFHDKNILAPFSAGEAPMALGGFGGTELLMSRA